MRVLAVEHELEHDERPVVALVAAGHEVVRCDDGVDGDLCAGMPGQSGCPLDRWPVDVVMAVRGPGGASTESEAGVRCAIRRRIPVMVVGRPEGAVYEHRVDAVMDPLDPRLGDRVEELGRAAMEPAIAAVRSAVVDVMARHGYVDVATGVVITHDDSRLRVAVRTSTETDARTSQAAAVRAMAVLQDFDLWFDSVDIAVDSP
jgi:hypothetical protein